MRISRIIVALAVMLVGAGGIYMYTTGRQVRGQSVFGSGFEVTDCNQITEQDVYELCQRIITRDPQEFGTIMMTNRFHGHIGPNNIYGARMGMYAMKLLGGKLHEVNVVSEAGWQRPGSCLNDGITIAVGASPGWGHMLQIPEAATNAGKMAATFTYKDKSVRLEVKPEIVSESEAVIKASLERYGGLTEDYFRDVRNEALKVWENYPQEEMFLVTYPPNNGHYCDANEYNISNYENRLHNFLHTAPTNREIMSFVDEDQCVRNGSVDIKDGIMTVGADWIDGGQRVEFEHGVL